MFANNRICKLLAIKYPIIQAGMVWNSGHKLATAVANAGGLGLLGGGSMTPEILTEHIHKCQDNVINGVWGVNLPLIYAHIEKLIEIVVKEKVAVVVTSAGNPTTWTPQLQAAGIKVIHVVSNVKFAQKAVAAGVDAIVCEGTEAGGHNGKDEITTFCLIPQVAKAVSIPLIAAGGIATGAGLLAALVLGADGVQIGTRFAATVESSSHHAFKEAIVAADDTATDLVLKSLTPVRMIKNELWKKISTAENNGAKPEELLTLLGKGRSRLGMFEGDLQAGELEIGQIAGLIDSILPASEVINNIITEYKALVLSIQSQNQKF
jgi:enoyl-[acyl-carrier protein] reductase II